jgi:segregation and condensation protein A
VRRLQEYERYKEAAENIGALPRLERDLHQAHAEVTERKVEVKLPDLALKEMLLAFQDVLSRAEMFARLHVQREPLSVRQRMGEILLKLDNERFVDFPNLFDPREGRIGIVVTFIALLELLRESVIELVQAEPFSPIHVRAAGKAREDDANQTAEEQAGQAN